MFSSVTNVVLNLVSAKCLLCYMQTMLSCYRIRVPGYGKRWMLCKIIQIFESWKWMHINPNFWYLRKADAEQMSAGFTIMPRSSKQIAFRTWGSFSFREAQWSPRKRHSLNKLWKQFWLPEKMFNFHYINPAELKDLFYKIVVPILNNSAEVWGFHLGVDVERVHLKFWKYIGGQA